MVYIRYLILVIILNFLLIKPALAETCYEEQTTEKPGYAWCESLWSSDIYEYYGVWRCSETDTGYSSDKCTSQPPECTFTTTEQVEVPCKETPPEEDNQGLLEMLEGLIEWFANLCNIFINIWNNLVGILNFILGMVLDPLGFLWWCFVGMMTFFINILPQTPEQFTLNYAVQQIAVTTGLGVSLVNELFGIASWFLIIMAVIKIYKLLPFKMS